MAEYIRWAVYVNYKLGGRKGTMDRIAKDEAFNRLETLLNACVERTDAGFNVEKVVAQLSEYDYAEDMFRRMIEVGYFREFLDQLECFFQHHPATSGFAQRC